MWILVGEDAINVDNVTLIRFEITHEMKIIFQLVDSREIIVKYGNDEKTFNKFRKKILNMLNKRRWFWW